MKKQSMFHSFFARSLLTNLLACMLLIVVIAPLCLNFYNAFYDRQKENLQDSLKVMLEDLSSNLNSLNEMIGNAGKNKILAKLGFIQGSVPPSASWDILTAKAYISSVASNSYVADCVAVFSKNNLLLTRHAAFYNTDDFSKFYSLEGENYPEMFSMVNSLGNYSHFLKATQLRTSPFASNSGAVYQPVEEVPTGTPLAFCYYMPLSVQYDYGGCFLLIKESSLLDKLPKVLPPLIPVLFAYS